MATAGRAIRFRRNRASSSSEKCEASHIEPPFPHEMILWPFFKASIIIVAAALIRATLSSSPINECKTSDISLKLFLMIRSIGVDN